MPEQCDGAASIALGGATVHGRSRRLFAIFENYLANGSPGKSAAKPVVIYAKNYALFVSAGSHQSQRPSDKRCGSSHWGPGDVDRYVFEMSIERASGSGIGTLALRPGHFLIVGLVDQVS